MKLKDISTWAKKEIRTISVLSDVCSLPYALQVRQFVPLPQDSQSRGWMDGKYKKFMETTPFAIVNMSNAVKHMREYIDKNVTKGMEFLLQETDPLIKETYAFAIRHAERHGVSTKFHASLKFLLFRMAEHKQLVLCRVVNYILVVRSASSPHQVGTVLAGCRFSELLSLEGIGALFENESLF
jgi:hypothetical protein